MDTLLPPLEVGPLVPLEGLGRGADAWEQALGKRGAGRLVEE